MPRQNRFAMASRCKLIVDEIGELVQTLDDNSKAHEVLYFDDKVKDAEGLLFRAQQQFPDDADIIQVEARFRAELSQEDRALRALERAWKAGPRGTGTAIRIASIYNERSRSSEAFKILNDALKTHQDDKQLHRAIAVHHIINSTSEPRYIEEHLRRSYSKEDQNFEDRHLHARIYFR